MKKLVLLAALAALAACSREEEEAPAPVETATETPDTMAADTIAPGTYDVRMADGTTGTTVISADGTYVDTDAEGNETRGTWVRRDGLDCFDPEGDEPEVCWTPAPPAADGSFTATAPDGTVVTVTPRAAAVATPTT